MSDKNCFRCDGSGKICMICGENTSACNCDAETVSEYIAEFQDSNVDDCPDCNDDD